MWTREQLEDFRGAEVDDLVGPDVRLVFVGINPGLMTAATNTHFAHPSNRFYPALHLAGIIDRAIPPDGMDDEDRAHLLARGIAITNVVRHATARASELTTADYRVGAEELVARVAGWGPAVVAIAGLTAYRTAFRRRGAVAGKQPDGLGDARLWVVPNPSGLNAHETVLSLARAYREPAVAAGVEVSPARW
ncbi:mismatch-specific DNA-glycosylase [Salsipaludibacter albus]|uniref:mismatch-specific DNA-glycosylase n=1 Tax=Salsipaludibacter albus TaxID=2849650 RepID=UPI001EE4D847|nr:mismatch-specific DNA-glycosylase [Salsipaludibacter albus]MBY5163887.1 mismatch-specific DNA-glycosylase [Salsipaludibacter albus]